MVDISTVGIVSIVPVTKRSAVETSRRELFFSKRHRSVLTPSWFSSNRAWKNRRRCGGGYAPSYRVIDPEEIIEYASGVWRYVAVHSIQEHKERLWAVLQTGLLTLPDRRRTKSTYKKERAGSVDISHERVI